MLIQLPQIKEQTLMQMADNTAQLRESIKSLKDFRKISDFQRDPSITNINLSIGEKRTFERLQRSAKKRYDKEIKELMSKLPEASPEQQMQIIRDVQELRTKLPTIEGFKTKRGYSNVIHRLERERTKALEYGQRVQLDRSHFIAALEKISMSPADHLMLASVVNRVSNMSDSEFYEFQQSYGNVIDLGYVYDLGMETQQKLTEIDYALTLEGY